MSKKRMAVLFDLDGTLVDTAPDFILAANELRAALGWPPLPGATIAAQVSNGALAVTRVTYAIDAGHPSFEQRRQNLLDAYEKHLGAASMLYAGLDVMLAQLDVKGIPWGVVTNKPLRYAAPLMDRLALSTNCATLVCPDHVAERKPHPEGLLLAAKQMGMAAEDCIYAGDHLRDIEAGRAANMHTIAAAFGYIAPDDDPLRWEADAIAETSVALCEIVLQGVQG
ncbi:MAG: HAD-IA family hydrolase [Pseudomonadales bacterium]